VTDTKPTVYEALAAVMTDVRAVGKEQRNTDQNYRFRGIDDVVNAVGPALRTHGVILLPELLDVSYRDVRTTRDKPAREVTVRVRYTFIGPAGDSSLPVVVPGESMDSGDKGTAKAMSVAMRIALLQALCLPTDEPDPDASTYERAYPTRPEPPAAAQQSEPADEARNDLLDACRTNNWDPRQVAAAFHAATKADLRTEPNADTIRNFRRDLEAAPDQILALAGAPS
jgi:hypothetical protein